MSAFARSDVLYTAPTLADGGCGRGHSRPVVQGAPVKVWELTDCPQCENYLRNHDPHWAGTISEIPETPDEIRIREDQELRGKRDAATATAQSLEKIANLPEGMATAFATAFAEALKTMNGAPALHGGEARCPGGHTVPGGAAFCPACGVPVQSAEKRVVESTVVQPEDSRPDRQYFVDGTLPAPGSAAVYTSGQQAEPLTSQHVDELKAALGAVQADPAWGHKVVVTPPAPQVQQVGDSVRIKRRRRKYSTASLAGKSLPELREIAREIGAPIKRSKDDQIAAIGATEKG